MARAVKPTIMIPNPDPSSGPQLDYASYLRQMCQRDPRWQSMFPPATPAQVETAKRRAMKELGGVLSDDYLQLVQWINGGGRSVCFAGTHPFSYKPLFGPREHVAAGIIEENLRYRDYEWADSHEIVYAEGSDCLFLPGDAPGSWVGRETRSRQVLWRADSFLAMLRFAYEDDATDAMAR